MIGLGKAWAVLKIFGLVLAAYLILLVFWQPISGSLLNAAAVGDSLNMTYAGPASRASLLWLWFMPFAGGVIATVIVLRREG